MNEIAADIGMSKASLYYYFPDKEKIFIAVVEQDIAEFVQVIESLISRTSKASFKLKKYVVTRNEFLVRLLNLAKVETLIASDVFNPVYDELKVSFFNKEMELVQKIFQQGIDQQEFNKFPVKEYADLFLSSMVGLRATALTSKATENRNPDYDKVERQTSLFVELFLKSVRSN